MGVLQNNYAQIVPGALISASYVSDIYDVLTGNEPEDITISGSFVVSGSAISTVGFTGSLSGTSSFAVSSSNAVSSSYAISASWAPFSGVATTALTASYVLLIGSASASDTSISSSYASTASYVEIAQTASYALYAVSASYEINYETSSSYSDHALSASYAPPTLWSDIYTSATNHIIYVSPSGSDANDGLSSTKPKQTLYQAKISASANSVVVIGAGEYVYDNRNSVGNPWNNRQDEINLWKDGVTYYFEPGSKVVIKTENLSQDLYLFNPGTGSDETCTVDGYLEFENLGFGTDSGGIGTFLSAGGDNGYTFKANVKRLYSDHNQVISISKSNVAGTTGSIDIKSQEEYWTYVGGNVSAGSFYYIQGNGTDSKLICNISCDTRTYDDATKGSYSIYFRGTFSSDSRVNIYGKTCINLSKTLFRFRNTNLPEINMNIDKIYYNYEKLTYSGALITEIFDPGNLSNFTLNIYGDLIDYSDNSYSSGRLFEVTGPNIKINYFGNIYTKTTGGTGRSIVYCDNYPFSNGNSSNNQINITGNIFLLGSSETTSVLFQSYGSNSIINFNGNIIGNFQTLAHPKAGGIVNINNSKIESNANNGKIYIHTDNTTSTMTISNSNIKMLNTGSALTDGRYLKVLVNNSTISNTGTTDVLYNSTSIGSLQVLNSSIYTGGGSAINYSSPFNSAFTVINTAYSGSLTGSLTQLTEMIV